MGAACHLWWVGSIPLPGVAPPCGIRLGFGVFGLSHTYSPPMRDSEHLFAPDPQPDARRIPRYPPQLRNKVSTSRQPSDIPDLISQRKHHYRPVIQFFFFFPYITCTSVERRPRPAPSSPLTGPTVANDKTVLPGIQGFFPSFFPSVHDVPHCGP